jgi:acid phosphatase family membrane protein YuiD
LTLHLSSFQTQYSVAIVVVRDAIGWTTHAGHLAQILNQLLVRRKMTAVRMLADEDDVVMCVNGPGRVR